MSLVIENLYYSDEHEWVKVDDKNNAVIGITDYAQDSLGDIVFVELPQVGEDFAQMDQVGVLESVKTVSNIYLPVSGRITEINDAVVDNPALINSSPYDEGWLIKMEIYEPAELEDLKSSEEYEELTKDET
ncbi:MAG: glycine cleavage system protein GcvH [Candidatus Margulisiibacteriota bacterium]